MAIQYTASSRSIKVTAGGTGDLQPNFYSWSGNSYFSGSADFKLGFPAEPFNLEIVSDQVDLPPNAPHNAEFNVAAEYCNKNWILTVKGQSNTPDANGSTVCAWTQSGTDNKTGITWDGSCDGGGNPTKPNGNTTECNADTNSAWANYNTLANRNADTARAYAESKCKRLC